MSERGCIGEHPWTGGTDFRPLRVTAHIIEEIAEQSIGDIMLDALLTKAIAIRDGLPPASADAWHRVGLPIARSACGRIILASNCHGARVATELLHAHKRFPTAEALNYGDVRLGRIRIDAGPDRSYRMPFPFAYLKGEQLAWWCVGDRLEIQRLLDDWIGYIGRKRAHWHGHVVEWVVDECEPWDGFPVMRDGLPLRPLPLDWPGLREDAEVALRNLVPPYWRHTDEEPCAVP